MLRLPSLKLTTTTMVVTIMNMIMIEAMRDSAAARNEVWGSEGLGLRGALETFPTRASL